MLAKTIKLCILAMSVMCTSLFAAPILTALPPLTVDVSGIPSYGEYGDPGNTVLSFKVGANTTVTSIAFDVQLSAFIPSYLSDMQLRFGDSSESINLILTLGNGDDTSGTKIYSGSIDLTPLDLTFNVGGDGLLRLEFFEFVKDLPYGFPDGQWDAGSLTFGLARAVPEPDSFPLIGIALLVLALNGRRRRAPVAA